MTSQTRNKKKQAILNVAIEVFREMGFHNASMNIIAARVGGSKSTLYNHFPSKEAIFLEVIRNFTQIQNLEENPGLTVLTEETQSYIESAFRVLEEPLTDIKETLLHFGKNYVRFLYMPEVLTIRRLLIAESRQSEIAQLYYVNGLKKSLMRISVYLDNAMKNGQLKKTDSFIAASHLRSLLTAECYEYYFLDKDQPLLPKQIQEMVNNAVAVFMAAYGK